MDRQAGQAVVSATSRPEVVSMSRITAGGRSLRYELSIIQQPRRARACGAGAKASADRRPVDPPPILSLRIFEAGPAHVEQDITFQYPSTFFMFAGLQSDRQIAHARNMNNDHPKRDVLAGQNVTSASPYERPTPALYFIFPDLSVRHEGRYHFVFDLFESARAPEDESRDEAHPGSVACVANRLKIASEAFTVYSAKRFPGLSESTALSRQLAEQGSRIRIRRDIRMRRPNSKSQAKDWPDYEDDAVQAARMPHTPDSYTQSRQMGDALQRPHSASSRGHGPPSDTLSRRTSFHDLNQPYLMQQPQQPQQQHQPSHQQNVFAHPSASYAPMQSQPYSQQSFMHPPPPQYAGPPYQAAQTPPQQQQQQPSYYPYGSTQQQQQQQQQQMQYPPITTNSTSFDSNTYAQRSPADYTALSAEPRRASMQASVPPSTTSMYSQHTAPQHTQQPTYSQQSPMYADSIPQPHSLSMQPQQHAQQGSSSDIFAPRTQNAASDPSRASTRNTTPIPPTLNSRANFPTKLPPLATTVTYDRLEASPSSAAPVSAYPGSMPTPNESHKRSYGSTFPTGWQNLANKQGARPGDHVFTPGSLSLAADPDVDGSSDSMDAYDRPVTYRRAGGTTATRTHV